MPACAMDLMCSSTAKVASAVLGRSHPGSWLNWASALVRQCEPYARHVLVLSKRPSRRSLALKETPEGAPGTSQAATIDRAIGALLGLAAGDAVGTSLEFKTRDSYRVGPYAGATVPSNGNLFFSLLLRIVHVAIERTKVYRSSGGSPDNDAAPVMRILLALDEIGFCEPI